MFGKVIHVGESVVFELARPVTMEAMYTMAGTERRLIYETFVGVARDYMGVPFGYEFGGIDGRGMWFVFGSGFETPLDAIAGMFNEFKEV